MPAIVGAAMAPASGTGRPLTVSELTAQVRTVLEETMSRCWVIGEIAEYTHHGSGHRYLTLKDDSSQLSVVMFRHQGRKLGFTPERGMQIMCYGHISVYERGGRYQFYAEQMQPAGQGELALAFERLKLKLEEEGLFAPERKRPLPRFPRSVGVVTSPTGAAIRDIINVLTRRSPGVQIILRPCRVQGPGAAGEIAAAIADLNRYGAVDILIVGRGGGSPEDLWPFNEEVVARAIYRSEKPVIAAVGHEVDYTIADYVADYRAPTPSAAAEVVVQEHTALLQGVGERRQRLSQAMEKLLAAHERRLQDMDPDRLFRRLSDRLQQTSQYVDERRQDLVRSFAWFIRSRRQEWQSSSVRLQTLSPLAHLARGFSLCQRQEDGTVVRSSRQVQPEELVNLRFHQGSATARIEATQHE